MTAPQIIAAIVLTTIALYVLLWALDRNDHHDDGPW